MDVMSSRECRIQLGPEGQRDRDKYAKDRFSFPGNSPSREEAVGTHRLLCRRPDYTHWGQLRETL